MSAECKKFVNGFLTRVEFQLYPTKNGVLNITVLIIHTTFLPSSNTM